MSEDPRRRGGVQFGLAALFVLTAAIGGACALARVDPSLAMAAVPPLLVGVGVGLFSSSRAQLLTAPPIAAALVPLPIAIMAVWPFTLGNPFLDFLTWWVMLFPLALLFGAIPAVAGSALGYWFKGGRIFRKIRD